MYTYILSKRNGWSAALAELLLPKLYKLSSLSFIHVCACNVSLFARDYFVNGL
jgi:hypothetical protein